MKGHVTFVKQIFMMFIAFYYFRNEVIADGSDVQSFPKWSEKSRSPCIRTERAIPRGAGLEGRMGREDEGRRRQEEKEECSAAEGGRKAACLVCFALSLKNPSSLHSLPSPSFVPPFSTFIVTMANLWGRSRWREFFWSRGTGGREGIAFVSTPFSASLQAAPSVRRSMKMGKNAPKRRAVLPVRPTSDMSFWTRCQPAI